MNCGMSNYLQEQLLNGVLMNTAYTFPTEVKLALFSTFIQPQDAIGDPTELSGDGYARTTVSFGAWADGFSVNDADCAFPIATADWDAVIGWAIIFQASGSPSGDDKILFFRNGCPKVVVDGETYTLEAGEIRIAVNPCGC